MPGLTIDGNDVVEVYLTVREAVERARAGEGPTLIEAMTYRWGQHSMRANIRDPRPKEEYEDWTKTRDPIKRTEKQIRTQKAASSKRLQAIYSNVEDASSCYSNASTGQGSKFISRKTNCE